MGRLGAKGMATALCLGLTLAVARADDGDGGDLHSLPPAKPSMWSSTFGSKDAAPAPKKAPVVEAPTTTPPPPVVANSPAQVLIREQNALLRRQQVCDALTEIADQKGDEALRDQVYQLLDKSWSVFLQRTNGCVGRMPDQAALTRAAQPAAPDRRAAAPDTTSWNQRGE
jgi:hypothetical protein